MLVNDVRSLEDIHEYVKKVWGNNPLYILEANAKYMYIYGKEIGKQEADADRALLQQYGTDMVKLADAAARKRGFNTNMVAGFCDLFRTAYIEAYTDYMKKNPIVCECCGQPLPPKEG